MRELVASTTRQKPIIALVDLDMSRGGMSLIEVHTQLLEADALYEKWAFNNESDAPRGKVLYDHLVTHEPIEWNRIGHFQDITMRLIAERLLPDGVGATYVDREIVNQKLKPLGPASRGFHVYCSERNPGALELMEEVSRERGYEMQLTAKTTAKTSNMLFLAADAANLVNCDHMLLYLTGQTWTCGEASAALGAELLKAMDLGIHVMLVHEMAGGGGQDARFGCEFSTFFGHPDGATPAELLKCGIYSEIAVPLKGGAWREASMVLMGMALGMSKDDTALAQEGDDVLGLEEATVERISSSVLNFMRRSSLIQRSTQRMSTVTSQRVQVSVVAGPEAAISSTCASASVSHEEHIDVEMSAVPIGAPSAADEAQPPGNERVQQTLKRVRREQRRKASSRGIDIDDPDPPVI